MISNEATGASAAVAIGAATALDFGLLEQVPRSALALTVLLSTGAVWYFVKRDYQRFIRHLRETEKLKNRIVAVETRVGLRDAEDEPDEGDAE